MMCIDRNGICCRCISQRVQDIPLNSQIHNPSIKALNVFREKSECVQCLHFLSIIVVFARTCIWIQPVSRGPPNLILRSNYF